MRLETDNASYASAPDSGSFSTPAVVHATPFSQYQTSATVSVTIPSTTAHNCLVIAANLGNSGATNQTITGVTLGGGADHWAAALQAGSAASGRVEFWTDRDCAGGQTAVVITESTLTGSIITGIIYEISGLDLAAPLDKTSSNPWTSGTSFTSNATAATTQAKEIAVGIGGEFTASGTPTVSGPSSPWVNQAQVSINFTGTSRQTSVSGTNILSSTGAQTYSGSSTIANGGAGYAGIITLKAASVGGLQVTSGTLSVRVDCLISDWVGNHTLAAKWGATTAAQAWGLWTNGDGTVVFAFGTGAATFSQTSTVPLPYFGQRIAIRADYVIGSGTITFYTAPNMSGSWTQLGDAFSFSPRAQTGASGQAVQVGDMATLNGMYGEMYEFQLLSTGTPIADPVFTSQTAGVSSFADAQGNTWTLAGTAEISSRSYRFHGEVASLPKAADPSSRNAYAQAQAGGLLRRLTQQQSPANSALYRAYTRLTSAIQLSDYWPGEDGSRATQIASASGGTAMVISGSPQLASNSDFDCSAPIAVMNSAIFTGRVNTGAVTWTDNVVRFLLSIPAGGDLDGHTIAGFHTTGNCRTVNLVYNTASSGSLTMTGLNAAGGTVFTAGPLTGLNGHKMRVSMELQAGGNWALWTYTIGAPVSVGLTGSGAGTIGVPTQVNFGVAQSSAMGHFSVQGVADNPADLYQPLNAWTGELAGTRFNRLCTEEGIACRITGPPELSQPMGVQTVQTIAALLQECETTDQGFITEPRQVLGLGYIVDWARTNQPPVAVVNWNAEQVGQGFSPVSDDSAVVNDVTMTAADGSSSRQTLDTGPMSTAAPPSGVGRFDTSVTVNPADDGQLDDLAAWYLHVNSADEDRYPQIPFQIARGTVPAGVLAADIGAHIQITNTPNWVPTDTVDQIVAGTTETIGPQPAYGIVFNGIPERPYETAVANTAKADTPGSTVHANASSGAGTFTVDNTDDTCRWTTTGTFPFDLNVAGQQITVSACSGTSSPQTFTVSAWGVNGVTKNLTAGDPVRLWKTPTAKLGG